MAIMDYVTPGITGIDFEDNLFVTTELNRDENLKVKGYIESRGGVIKNSVTKITNYLIYKDGEEETTKYKKAMELIRDKGLEITVLSLKTFSDLLTMKVTTGISKISFEGSQFVTTKLDGDENEEVKGYIKSRGGIIRKSVTKSTNYLIYKGGEWETAEYEKAMELNRDKGQKITVLPLSLFLEIGIGEGLMEFGRYPFETDGTEKPIRWIILKKEEKKALLLSAYGLDAKPCNERFEAVTWEECTLRKWLNEDFYNDAFTEEEKKRICLTKLQNEDNPSWHTPGGNDTEDRVFLLSIGEAERFLPEAIVRRRKPTLFAIENGAYESWKGHCWWWLRSPGGFPNNAASVDDGGGIYDNGSNVHYSSNAVCPALWINLESGIG